MQHSDGLSELNRVIGFHKVNCIAPSSIGTRATHPLPAPISPARRLDTEPVTPGSAYRARAGPLPAARASDALNRGVALDQREQVNRSNIRRCHNSPSGNTGNTGNSSNTGSRGYTPP